MNQKYSLIVVSMLPSEWHGRSLFVLLDFLNDLCCVQLYIISFDEEIKFCCAFYTILRLAIDDSILNSQKSARIKNN